MTLEIARWILLAVFCIGCFLLLYESFRIGDEQRKERK